MSAYLSDGVDLFELVRVDEHANFGLGPVRVYRSVTLTNARTDETFCVQADLSALRLQPVGAAP